MEKFNGLVFNRLKHHKLAPAALASVIINSANELIIKQLKAEPSEVNAFQFKEGCLIIGTASSVWSQEVWGFSEELLSKLKQKYGGKVISKIRIKGLTTD